MKKYLTFILVLACALSLADCKTGGTETVSAILSDIDAEGIVSASFDSLIPTYIYNIEDLLIVGELLDTLDGAVYTACSPPEEPVGSLALIDITARENKYCLDAVNNSAFLVSVNSKGR